jgi:hypothetical protein
MRRLIAALTVATSLVTAGACSKAGMGKGVRTDISARMATISAPVQMCYAVALERNRRLKGMMVLSFRAAPSTGQFDQINVVRDEVGDPQVRTCVIEAVGKLKLETPQKTAVTVNYPIDFQPSK